MNNFILQNKIIKINVGGQQFKTSRPLLISHSQELETIFESTQDTNFTLENLDPDAFGQFINFVNYRKVDFNKCSFDKLLEIYDFCKAPLFRDYLALNAPSLDMQFNFLETYFNENIPSDFLIINLASKINEIIENWDNVHMIDSNHLIRVLKKSDLSQIEPDKIFNFITNTIQNRKDNPAEIIKLFNLTIFPIEKLYDLQKEAQENNINVPFLHEIQLNKDLLDFKSQEIKIIDSKITYIKNKNIKAIPSIEFQMVKSYNDKNEIQAIAKIENEKIFFSLLIIGQENVGKTSLIYRVFVKQFADRKISQELPSAHYNYISKSSNLDIIDVDGFVSNDYIRDTYAPQSQFFLFVCSPDVEDSIDYIEAYYKKICHLRNTNYVPSIVCLNKADLLDTFDTFRTKAQNFAISINAELIEVSAKNGQNTDSIFEKASEKYSKITFNSPKFIQSETQ